MSKNLITHQLKNLPSNTSILQLLAKARNDGPITNNTIDEIAAKHSLPPAWVRATAQFYDTLDPQAKQHLVQCCDGEACRAARGDEVKQQIKNESKKNVGSITCIGLCGHAPAAMVENHPISLADKKSYESLVNYLKTGTPIQSNTPTYNHYTRPKPAVHLLLPKLSPPNTDITIEKHHYHVLKNIAGTQTPEQLREQIHVSQLRGRGGAGFPTAIKLDTVANSPVKDGSNRRFVVINGDEGDAGSYIDKELMESAPHLVLEGALLAAYGVNATAIYIYIRHEYPQANQNMQLALKQIEESPILATNSSSGIINCPIHIIRGEGAYVCGEETSLLRSIEGLPAQVSIRPPYPAQVGLYGCPTAVQNVETICNLPIIFEHGAKYYAGVGSEKSRGTKLVSLNSAVLRPGLYEAEFGVSLSTIILDWAGGLPKGRTIQAVQIGGPLGAILPPELLDTPFSFEGLAQAGGTLGHGSIVVYDDRVDLLAIAQGLFTFAAKESCGKCFPCRLGSTRGEELLRDMRADGISSEKLQLLDDLNETLEVGSLCGLGGMLPTPIKSLLRFFPHLWSVDGDKR
ncbi:MAG: NAD(P)H-dependent oxidoreductase subunit E [Magnetococcales bacterium]|nr:NAD(P)H-dependent oxidoreductase subunit E [Magnetococcales bacterium]